MREQIQGWLDKLRQGTLQAADLQAALDQSPRQQLLYLRAGSIGVDSTVTGMALECDGQVHERPQDPADWPCGARKSWIATRRVCRRDCAGMSSGCGVPACARSSRGGHLCAHSRPARLREAPRGVYPGSTSCEIWDTSRYKVPPRDSTSGGMRWYRYLYYCLPLYIGHSEIMMILQ